MGKCQRMPSSPRSHCYLDHGKRQHLFGPSPHNDYLVPGPPLTYLDPGTYSLFGPWPCNAYMQHCLFGPWPRDVYLVPRPLHLQFLPTHYYLAQSNAYLVAPGPPQPDRLLPRDLVPHASLPNFDIFKPYRNTQPNTFYSSPRGMSSLLSSPLFFSCSVHLFCEFPSHTVLSVHTL